jgi:GNAT superfamily N-acetyltransferase
MTQTITYSTVKSRIDNQLRKHYEGQKLGTFTHQPDTDNFTRFTDLVSKVIDECSEEGDNTTFTILDSYLTSFNFQNKVYFKLSNSRQIECNDFRLVFSPHGKDGVELYIIESFNQGQGWGSRILQLLNNITKETGITVYLRPVSFGSTDIDQLRKWYSRNGFKRCCKNLYWSNK